MAKQKLLTHAIFLGVLATTAPLTDRAFAAGAIQLGEDKFLNIGIGVRTELSSIEDAAPSGEDRSFDFNLNNFRLYLAGQLNPLVGVAFTTDVDSNGNVKIIDGIAQLSLSKSFNLWAGLFHSPQSRAGLSGPYYSNAWDFPKVANGGPGVIAGRDEGIGAWGYLADDRLKYQVGLFEGWGDAPSGNESPMIGGRLVYNLWDRETGFYNAGTYYGAKDVFAVGLVAKSQSDALLPGNIVGDYSEFNIDLLIEKALPGGGVATLEAAYFDYDYGPAGDGDGNYVVLSYLLPGATGATGRWQPMVRLQEGESDVNPIDTDRIDVGFNYIIEGHNARINLVYFDDSDIEQSGFKIGFQYQIR